MCFPLSVQAWAYMRSDTACDLKKKKTEVNNLVLIIKAVRFLAVCIFVLYKLRFFPLEMFFRKRIQKDNITFHPNSTVSYKEYRSYYFEPSMSVGNESDVLTIPNMLVLVSQYFLLLNFAINSVTVLQRWIPSVPPGRSSHVGKPVRSCAHDHQHGIQDLRWGAVPDKDSGGADVGLWQQAGEFPQ